MAADRREPSDPIFPGLVFNDCVIGEEAPLGSIQVADGVSRGQAKRRYESEAGCGFVEVRCRLAWARFLTRQEAWDSWGRDQWANDQYPAVPSMVPAEPPGDWDPWIDEWVPCWEFCSRDAPGATRVWICSEAVAEPAWRAVGARGGA